MAEPFDVYTDAFTISIHPLSACVVFGLSPAGSSGDFNPPIDLGAVRMSNQQLKVLVFALWDNIKRMEADSDEIHVPERVTSQLEIPREIWDSFWMPERG